MSGSIIRRWDARATDDAVLTERAVLGAVARLSGPTPARAAMPGWVAALMSGHDGHAAHDTQLQREDGG